MVPTVAYGFPVEYGFPVDGIVGSPSDDGGFVRCVLDRAPACVVVVDPNGRVAYANRALRHLAGRLDEDVIGSDFVEFLDPTDVSWASTAFGEVMSSMTVESGDGHLWAPVRLRLLRPDGGSVPVMVTGRGGVPGVAGIVYDIRPAHSEELLSRVLRGISAGTPVDDLLALVMEMIVVGPFELSAAVLQPDDEGRFQVVADTDPELAECLVAEGPVPWSNPVSEPVLERVGRIAGPVGTRLGEAGFVDLWHLAVESALGASTYRVVVASPVRHVTSHGIIERVREAHELAGVVLMRSQTDEMLSHAASHDPLTRLPNRTGFRQRANGLRHGPMVALYVDLDGFKAINDRHGHLAGDHVLSVIADRLRTATRPGDLVARLGGDEFVVVLAPDATRDPEERGRSTAHRICDLVSETIDLGDDRVVGVAASVGITVAPPDIELDRLLHDADEAMYAAKRAGGNQHVLL